MEKKEFSMSKLKSDAAEVDLGRIFKSVLSKAWMVALVAILCAALALTGTLYFMEPQYQSSVMFYVNNNNKPSGLSPSVTYADITAAKSLVETCLVILDTRETVQDVIEHAELEYSYGQVRGMISAEGVNETEVFKVTVTSNDPNEAYAIASSITDVLPGRIKDAVNGSSVAVVDKPVVPTSKSGPSYTQNTLLGFLIGLVLAVGAVTIVEILDTTMKSSEDVENSCTYPILATVPEMGNANKNAKKSKNGTENRSARVLVGEKINFTALEAYKLLCTKLQYAFSDDKKCHVFMVSSAMAGEGKSLTSVNLAHNLARLNKRVLLVDCDLRQPTLAEKVKMAKNPGLAEYLAGQAELKDVVRPGNPDLVGNGVDIVVAGTNPPNPIELLSSDKMQRMIESLETSYEYIILDLPPVGEVSDAMVAAKLADGAILVTRQNYCNRHAFKDTISQLEFINTKILGVVVNCTASHGTGYGYNYKYSRYSKYYRRSSSYGYSQKSAEVKQETK